jgi:hypothetical protein
VRRYIDQIDQLLERRPLPEETQSLAAGFRAGSIEPGEASRRIRRLIVEHGSLEVRVGLLEPPGEFTTAARLLREWIQASAENAIALEIWVTGTRSADPRADSYSQQYRNKERLADAAELAFRAEYHPLRDRFAGSP